MVTKSWYIFGNILVYVLVNVLDIAPFEPFTRYNTNDPANDVKKSTLDFSLFILIWSNKLKLLK